MLFSINVISPENFKKNYIFCGKQTENFFFMCIILSKID